MSGQRCSEDVRAKGSWPRFYPCKLPATVERDGKHYCATHDPERTKRLSAARRAKFDEAAKRRRIECAAPEMLAALKAAKAMLELLAEDYANNNCGKFSPKHIEIILKARAAIIKAQGGTP